MERNLVEGPTRDVKTLDFVLGSIGIGEEKYEVERTGLMGLVAMG